MVLMKRFILPVSLLSLCAILPLPAHAFDVVVIGSGMGGLSAATHLAVGGLEVLVLEQHHKVGGCTTSFQRGGFTFETSLHEMAGDGDTGPLADALREAGVWDKVEFIRIDPLYRTVGPGLDFRVPNKAEEAREALKSHWPAESRGIDRFFDLMKRVDADTNEYSKRPSTLASKALVPFRQPALFQWYRRTLADVLDRTIQDPALKAVLSQLWVYLGPPPSRLSSVIFLSCLQGYFDQGAWHVKGTSQALSDAYAARIRELGGEVRTGVRVDSIVIEDGRAVAVTTMEGDRIPARYIVSNADPFQTFYDLVGKDSTPRSFLRRLESMKPANSLVGLWLGLDVEPSFWGIEDHEIFVNSNLDPEVGYRAMMEARYDESAIAMTFNSNLGDPIYAPPGSSVLSIVSYSDIARWPHDRESYATMRARVTEQLLDVAERVAPGLRQHIIVQESFTPRTLEKYTLQKNGIPYGWEFSPEQLLRLEHESPIEGLYLAGSWTNPGHGVSTTQIGGQRTARAILKQEKRGPRN